MKRNENGGKKLFFYLLIMIIWVSVIIALCVFANDYEKWKMTLSACVGVGWTFFTIFIIGEIKDV